MPLSRWQKFQLKIRLRYHIRREIFTIGIPVAVAAVFVFWAFHSGFASVANPLTYGTASNNATIRQIEIQATEGNLSITSLNHAQAAASSAPIKQNLYLTVVAAPAIALTPIIVDTQRETRRTQHYEQDFADFLFELSELVRGGIDPAKAFLTLAKGEVGSITPFVKTASKQMSIGFTFEQAFKSVGASMKSALANRYIDLVIQASYSGGDVSALIQQAAIDMGAFLSLDKEKRAGLSQYTVVLYMGQVVLIVLAAIMVVQFIPELTQITNIGGAGLGSFLGTSDINNVPLERDLFFLVLINGILGGLVIGKISESKIKAGLKHSVILGIIALIAWDAYVLPGSSGATQTVHITVVSYDKTGLSGFKLPDPLLVNITDAHGVPVDAATVSFIMTGGGTANPASTATDVNGQAETTLRLGNVPGPEVILITSGNSQVAVVVNATSNGISGN